MLRKRAIRYLRRFFARTSRSSHFKSILSPRDASAVLRGRLPFRDNFPFLLTLLSSELMHNLFESTRTMPEKFVSGFRRTGEDTVALWKDADPSSTGCSTVPLTYIIQQIAWSRRILTLTVSQLLQYTHNSQPTLPIGQHKIQQITKLTYLQYNFCTAIEPVGIRR